MNGYEARFSGVGRLFGTTGLERFRRAHVCVVGLGGVGSWAVEALARSGIGELTLIDLDDICVSNVNRQLHALDGELVKPKVEVMPSPVDDSATRSASVSRSWLDFLLKEQGVSLPDRF